MLELNFSSDINFVNYIIRQVGVEFVDEFSKEIYIKNQLNANDKRNFNVVNSAIPIMLKYKFANDGLMGYHCSERKRAGSY
ncbi:hypothetical protein D1115_03695 [Vibrio alfacsensis]|uniref:Uncharacterized protein n=1 Tax=Vibrio alfacsensis TaxID=1074311 RepID=A0ABN5PAZ1_9VIBR|nr:hypothetical protein D1115_03695 [Vibrio alfacsensis]